MMKVRAVITLFAEYNEPGRALAARCSLSFVDASAQKLTKSKQITSLICDCCGLLDSVEQYVFLYDEEGLSLVQIKENTLLRIRADFHGGTARYRREKGGGNSQMIAKAVGLGSGTIPSVLDATAGLGRDAFVLATLGCAVEMVERVPEVRVLLQNGLAQAAAWALSNDLELTKILQRLSLVEADACQYLQECPPGRAPDVIYLDPMFPQKTKSAQVKKEMRVFHDLVGADSDAAELLPTALACARKRVVVKRPRLAEYLGQRKPSYALEGKSNRFDIYLCP